MNIIAYNFGQITVDDRIYDSDIILLSNCIVERWWRREGHSLAPEDLKVGSQPTAKYSCGRDGKQRSNEDSRRYAEIYGR